MSHIVLPSTLLRHILYLIIIICFAETNFNDNYISEYKLRKTFMNQPIIIGIHVYTWIATICWLPILYYLFIVDNIFDYKEEDTKDIKRLWDLCTSINDKDIDNLIELWY